MEYYSALKRKEILTNATAWMKSEDIMLSEIKPVLKIQILHDSTCTKHLVKFIETESRAGERGGDRELLFNRYRVSILQDEKNYGDGW